MSIKNLFGNSSKNGPANKDSTIIPLTSLSGSVLSSSLESSRQISAKRSFETRVIPPVDFSEVKNFARFGSAEEYYTNAIYHIYSSYPYDGSLAEKQEWHNASSHLENYVFNHEYPRTTGFALFSPGNDSWGTLQGSKVNTFGLSDTKEYIQIVGGPHTSTRRPGDPLEGGDVQGTFKDGFANIWEPATNRKSTLQLDFDKGVCVEFWLKKEADVSTSKTEKETVFDIWNESDDSSAYGRCIVYSEGGTIKAQMSSGSSDFSIQSDGSDSDGNWHHHAFVWQNKSSALQCEYYKDGVYVKKATHGSTMNEIAGTLKANIGSARRPGLTRAQVAALSGPESIEGYGKLSGSVDEFRYWTKSRDARQVGRNFWTSVHGATANDLSNDQSLGVYLKFNEGNTGDSTLDKVVLDYSGRISNGTWTVDGAKSFSGATYRSTGSAIDTAAAYATTDFSGSEFREPVLRQTHPDVVNYKAEKILSSSFHDSTNGSMIYNTLPSWVTEEDIREDGELKKLCQIMASYLDTMYMQVQTLPTIKHSKYVEDVTGSKPYPFMKHMLSSVGFRAPDLFTETKAINEYLDRDEKILFEESLSEVKNLIYRNIYNNITYIYKTKGTEKSFRNLIRCFGIDDEIYKVNSYGQNQVFDFKDRYQNISVKRNYLDFYETRWPAPDGSSSKNNRTNATVYSTGSAVPGIATGSGHSFTYECEVRFPRKTRSDEDKYVPYDDLTGSIFGLKSVPTTSSMSEDSELLYMWIEKQGEDAAHAPPGESEDVIFYAKLSDGTTLSSSIYKSVYENEEWLLAATIKQSKTNTIGVHKDSSESGEAGSFVFTGINTAGDYIANNFVLSTPISNSVLNQFMTSSKRAWLGAKRQNFVGNLQQITDVKIGSLRGWLGDLSYDELSAHAKDARNYGRTRPLRSSFLLQSGSSQGHIPSSETCIFDWSFDDVSLSDAAGEFLVRDATSGSAATSLYSSTELNLDNILSRKFEARGFNFPKSGYAVDRTYTISAKHRQPEIVVSSDQINILTQDDINFTRTTRPQNIVIRLEKSMYQIVSEDMLNMFAGVEEFNNLIGESVNKYRQQYKGLELLRRIYFDKVGNTPNVDKFIDYYKWMDDSMSQMLRQVFPMSADISEDVSNVVESHILERNKYLHKFPTMEFKGDDPEGAMRGIEELKYPWRFGHAAIVGKNKFWTRERQNHTDASRESVRKSIVTETSGTSPTLSGSAGAYSGDEYARRSLLRTYEVIADDPTIAIGSEKDRSRHVDGPSRAWDQSADSRRNFGFHRGLLKFGEPETYVELDFHQSPKWEVLDQSKVEEKDISFTKQEIVNTRARIYRDGTYDSGSSEDTLRSTDILPFTIHNSPALSGGYRAAYWQLGTSSVSFNNMHEDRSGNRRIAPLQGPFTEKYVGGLQYRHQELNYNAQDAGGIDTHSAARSRGEAWEIVDPGSSGFVFSSLLSEDFENGSLGAGSFSAGWTYQTSWNVVNTPTPTANTGPSAAHSNSYYAYSEATSVPAGTEQWLRTPQIDATEALASNFSGSFYYHMYGADMGTLEVQVQENAGPPTSSPWVSISVSWDGASSTILAGQQQLSSAAAWKLATFDLSAYAGSQLYIRFKHTKGLSNLGDPAIDLLTINHTDIGEFKLRDVNYFTKHRARSVMYREEGSKRPVNIKNIRQLTASATQSGVTHNTTIIGNYNKNYELVHTSDSLVNNYHLKKTVDKAFSEQVPADYIVENNIRTGLTSSFITPVVYTMDGGEYNSAYGPDLDTGIANYDVVYPIHSPPRHANDKAVGHHNWLILSQTTVPERSLHSNKSIIVNRFSSPGDSYTSRRASLDHDSEQYSPNNALPWRNHRVRHVLNSGSAEHFDGVHYIAAEAQEPTLSGSTMSGGYQHKIYKNPLCKPTLLNTTENLNWSTSSGLFDGGNDYLQCLPSNLGSIGSVQSFSVGAWINPDKNTGTQWIVSHTDVGSWIGARWQMALIHGGGSATDPSYFSVYIYEKDDASSTFKYYKANTEITKDAWYHVGFTWDLDTNTLKLFVNGVEAALTKSNDSTITSLCDSTTGLTAGESLTIGGRMHNGSIHNTEYFDGHIDEVSFWGRVLTVDEFKELYMPKVYLSFKEGTFGPSDLSKTTATMHGGRDSLLGWWRMGDGTYDTATLFVNQAPISLNGYPSETIGDMAVNHGPLTDAAVLPPKAVYYSMSNEKRYDNRYISHTIPRTSRQYSWVTASLANHDYIKDNVSLGFFEESTHENIDGEYVLPAASASDYGARRFAAPPSDSNQYFIWSTDNNAALTWFPHDFVGLNTLIYEPVTSSNNILGYDADKDLSGYVSTLHTKVDNTVDSPQNTTTFNALMLHRNGPYGYPSWKQIRTGEHPVAREHKKNSIFSLHYENVNKKPIITGSGNLFEDRGRVVNFSQSAVASRFKPLSILLDVGGQNIALRHSYANNLCAFASRWINRFYGIDKSEEQVYEQLYNMYAVPSNLVASPIRAFLKLKYKENVFPRDMNTYQKRIRKRLQFDDNESGYRIRGIDKWDSTTYWRDTPDNRFRSRHLAYDGARLDNPWVRSSTTSTDSLTNQVFNTQATATVTVGASGPSNGEQITIIGILSDGTTQSQAYTGQGTENTSTGQFNRSGANTATATSLAACINAKQVLSLKATAVSNVVHIEQIRAGAAGETTITENLTDTTKTDFTGGQASGGTRYSYPARDFAIVNVGEHTAGRGTGSFEHLQKIANNLTGAMSPYENYWAHDVLFSTQNDEENYTRSSLQAVASGSSRIYPSGAMGFAPHAQEQLSMWPCDISENVTNSKITGSRGVTHFDSQISAGKTHITASWYNSTAGETLITASFNAHDAAGSGAPSPMFGTLIHPSVYTPSDWRRDTIFDGGTNTVGAHRTAVANLVGLEGGQYLYNYQPYCGFYSDSSMIRRPHCNMYRNYGVLSMEMKPSTVHDIKGRGPFYDTHEDWADELKFIGQDYSILPEFRISEHMEYYIKDSGGDFFAENKAILTLDGADVSASADTPTSDLDYVFYRDYSNSDFMEHFEYFVEGHEGIGDVKTVSMTCRAIKKLLPYNGFYPSTRVVQLSQIFSSSYDGFLSGSSITSSYGFEGDMQNNDNHNIDIDRQEHKNDRSYLAVDPAFVLGKGGYLSGTSESNISADDYGDPYYAQRLNSFWQPLISPGVLLNSIKAGIAVDYPVLKANAVSSRGAGAFASTNTALPFNNAHTNQMLQLKYAPKLRIPFEAIVDQQRFMPKSPQRFNITGSNDGVMGDKLLPLFPNNTEESLIDYSLATVDQWSLNNSYNAGKKPFAIWDGANVPMFEMAAHNFVSEVPAFFLAGNGALTTFASDTQQQMKPMRSGSVYYMDVVLRKTDDLVTTEGPRKSYLYGLRQDPHDHSTETAGNNSGQWADLTAGGPRRGCVYGPPISGGKDHSTEIQWEGADNGSGYEAGMNAFGNNDTNATGLSNFKSFSDPAYAPWTPPYFYGRSVARISFSPAARYMMSTGESRKFSFEEIFAGCDVEYFNDHHMAKNEVGSTINALATGSYVSLKDGWMQNSASLNLFQLSKKPVIDIDPITGREQLVRNAGQEEDKIWVISTKWECPVLDFSLGHPDSGSYDFFRDNSIPRATGTGYRTYTSKYSTAGSSGSMNNGTSNVPWTLGSGSCRALWNTYGEIPSGSKGLYLSVEESHPFEVWQSRNAHTRATPAGTLADGSDYGTGSLASVCGFKTSKEKVGQIASAREISELVVAVPYLHTATKEQKDSKQVYWSKDFGRYFFRINGLSIALQLLHKSQTGNALPENMLYEGSPSVVNTSVTDLADKMGKYVFPPKMDFMKNKDEVKPFVMYTFEFNSLLDQEDLSDIWQGVMPKLSMKAEKEDVTVTHTSAPWEFFSGKQIPPDVKWMVFKVKKQAKTNYYDLVDDAKSDTRFKFNFDLESSKRKSPGYSYNWPYDYFSLVELAQLESEIVIDAKKDE